MQSANSQPNATRRRRSSPDMSAAQRLRLRFLESVVVWEGAVHRQRLVEMFGVTENHVSRDFKLYTGRHPHNLTYDLSRKRYLPTAKFRPQYASGSADEYLAMLRMVCDSGDVRLPGMPAPTEADVVPLTCGGVDAKTLQAITRAITDRTGLEVVYQSMRRPEPAKHSLWPHALVFSGTRWHARAYDLDAGSFRDFVLSRLTVKASLTQDCPEGAPERDAEWTSRVELEVKPAGRLSGPQRQAIAREYGMSGAAGKEMWTLSLRTCLVPYFLHLHRLDSKDRKPFLELADPSLVERHRFPDP